MGVTAERMARWVAYRLPHSVVKWCVVRAGAHATTGEWSGQEVGRLSYLEALNRW
jgi:hypothetical protein